MKSDPFDGKILAGSDGLGTVTSAMVEQRAREIARTEERDRYTDADLDRAYAELLGNTHESPAPEIPDGVDENFTDREISDHASGERVPKIGFEDEESVGQVLVEEGIEEAEHERRVAAIDTISREVRR